jgi:branched-subunit amino acid transport protein
MSELLLVAGMTAITFLIRYAMFAAVGRFEVPALVSKTLRFVPPAVLSAIILPSVLMPGGRALQLHIGSPHLAGALLALVVGRLTGNLLAVIVTGMAVFWLWQTPFVQALLPF